MLWMRNRKCEVEFHGKKLKSVLEENVRLCSHIRPSTQGSVMVSHMEKFLDHPVDTSGTHEVLDVSTGCSGNTPKQSHHYEVRKRKRNQKRADKRIGESRVDDPGYFVINMK